MKPQILRFLAIGGLIAIVAVIAREALGRALGQSNYGYVASIIVVYLVGIVVSYTMHHLFTFRMARGSMRADALARHGAIAIAMSMLAALLALGIRVLLLRLTLDIAAIAPGLAFAISLAIISSLSYSLNQKFVFVK